MRAGQPFVVANDGMNIHSSASTPNAPTTAPANRSQFGSGLRIGVMRCASAPSARPIVCPSVADDDEEQHRDRRRGSPDGSRRTTVTTSGTKRAAITRPTTMPTHASTRATKPSRHPPTAATADECDDDEVERVHRALVPLTYRAPAGGRG